MPSVKEKELQELFLFLQSRCASVGSERDLRGRDASPPGTHRKVCTLSNDTMWKVLMVSELFACTAQVEYILLLHLNVYNGLAIFARLSNSSFLCLSVPVTVRLTFIVDVKPQCYQNSVEEVIFVLTGI